MALSSDLLVPQPPSLPASDPPHVASQENLLLIPLDDPATVPSSLSLTMTLRSTVVSELRPISSNPTAIQQAPGFLSGSIHHPRRFTLVTTLQCPSILARFIAFVDWPDLYHLLCTCQHLRDLFRDTALKDVILARYVVGYGDCLRNRDLNHFQDVEISILDLDLLCASNAAA